MCHGDLADKGRSYVQEGAYIQASGTYLVSESLEVSGTALSTGGGGRLLGPAICWLRQRRTFTVVLEVQQQLNVISGVGA